MFRRVNIDGDAETNDDHRLIIAGRRCCGRHTQNNLSLTRLEGLPDGAVEG